MAKRILASYSVSYQTDTTGPPGQAVVRIGATDITVPPAQGLAPDEARRAAASFRYAGRTFRNTLFLW